MRRWLPVFFVAGAVACGGVHRANFSKVAQAGDAITASIAERPNLDRYRELLKGFSSELATARSQAQSRPDRAIVSDLESAEGLMNDLLAVWEERTTRQSDLLPLSGALAARVAKEYDLAVNTNEPPAIYANEAMQAIWGAAKQKLSAATGMLKTP